MAHRYHDLILVQRTTGEADVAPETLVGAPSAFFWRGAWYQVDAVLATWRLRDRWWAAPAADVTDVSTDANDANAASDSPASLASCAPSTDIEQPTERTYYRVLCRDPAGEQVFDLYYDAANGQWMLDRAHD
jgi:hypothetical protein